MSILLKRLWLLGLAAAAVVACGDSGSPPATAPTLTSIKVSGSDLLLVGQSETFTASDNAGAAVTTAWWGTDAPSVVSVEAYTGRITVVGTGTATIFADVGAVRGTKTIRTLPNFSGFWSGIYEEVGCEASGDFGPCPDSEYDFFISEMAMRFTQDRDVLSGTFKLGGGAEGTIVSGRVSSDGALTFTGAVRSGVVNIEVQNVRFESSQRGQMTGTFEQLRSSASRQGTQRIFGRLRTMAGGPRD